MFIWPRLLTGEGGMCGLVLSVYAYSEGYKNKTKTHVYDSMPSERTLLDKNKILFDYYWPLTLKVLSLF